LRGAGRLTRHRSAGYGPTGRRLLIGARAGGL
jgi:hypothetical protein